MSGPQRVVPFALIREFVLDCIMIAKNRGLTYSEGCAGLKACARLMRSVCHGDTYSSEGEAAWIDKLVRDEMAKRTHYRLVRDYDEMGIELLGDDLKFVRLAGAGDVSVDVVRACAKVGTRAQKGGGDGDAC